MKSGNHFIELVRQGREPKEIASVIPWSAIGPEDQRSLLREADALAKFEPEVSYRLLQTLFFLSKDDLYKIKVLRIVALHPSNDLTKRQNILKTMFRYIQSFAPSNKREEEEKIHSWAIYHYLNARTLLKLERFQEAIDELYEAKDAYQQGGNQSYVDRIQSEIWQIGDRYGLTLYPDGASSVDAGAIPPREGDALVAEQAELQKRLVSLEKKCTTLEEKIREFRSTQRSLKASVKKLTAEIETLEQQKDALAREITVFKQKKTNLTREITQQEEQRAQVTGEVERLQQQLSSLRQQKETLERNVSELKEQAKVPRKKAAPVERTDGFNGDLPDWLN